MFFFLLTLYCADTNECDSAVNPCSGLNSKCVNTIGSFECQCLPGFEETNDTCTGTLVDQCVHKIKVHIVEHITVVKFLVQILMNVKIGTHVIQKQSV